MSKAWHMKEFTFSCGHCHHTDRHMILRHQVHWTFICPKCNRTPYSVRRAGMSGHCFQPFTTEEITGEPVEVTSPAHRDRLLEENGLTMDRYSENTLSQRRRWHLDEISTTNNWTFDQVLEEIRKGRQS